MLLRMENAISDPTFPSLFGMSGDAKPANGSVSQGYWIDSNGAKHDLREIDYLAVTNLSEQDLSKERARGVLRTLLTYGAGYRHYVVKNGNIKEVTGFESALMEASALITDEPEPKKGFRSAKGTKQKKPAYQTLGHKKPY